MTAIFFANPASIHVRRWLTLMRSAQIQVEGWTVETPDPSQYGTWRRTYSRGGALRYAASGLRMRFRKPSSGIVHAHSASGYGLMAWLSGLPYFVTTYGSEVYQSRMRGVVYERMLGMILRGAARVTCTSAAMRAELVNVFRVEPERIRLFSMGISLDDFSFSREERLIARRSLGLNDAIVITSNRRMRPLYRIELIIHAFALLRNQDQRYRLILFEGDRSPAYARSLTELIAAKGLEQSVIVLHGFRNAEEVRKYLLASDVAVSIPASDQMSAAILEALACGVDIVASPIDAYEELFREGLAHRAALESADALAGSIEAAVAARRPGIVPAASWLQRYHSDEAAIQEVKRLYGEVCLVD